MCVCRYRTWMYLARTDWSKKEKENEKGTKTIASTITPQYRKSVNIRKHKYFPNEKAYVDFNENVMREKVNQ